MNLLWIIFQHYYTTWNISDVCSIRILCSPICAQETTFTIFILRNHSFTIYFYCNCTFTSLKWINIRCTNIYFVVIETLLLWDFCKKRMTNFSLIAIQANFMHYACTFHIIIDIIIDIIHWYYYYKIQNLYYKLLICQLIRLFVNNLRSICHIISKFLVLYF